MSLAAGFDFATVTAPFRMQPGLRRLAPGQAQLTPSRPGDPALREKLGVLRDFPMQALLAAPGFGAAAALQALCEHAAAEHPAAWQRGSDGRWHAPLLGWSLLGDELTLEADLVPEIGPCVQALPGPWRLPALLSLAFAEDFAVIDGDSARIPWLAVCLPSNWAPEEKVGRHFAEVHAPVADNHLLVSASDHLARLVTQADRWERFVWTITRHPMLHAHPDRVDATPWSPTATADELAARAFFRTEHQTFIPVAGLHQAVFTIRVGVAPLAQALADPAQARLVHDALSTMSPAVLAYRGLTEARERLLDWLARHAA
jgi:hypothetical protein